MSLVVLTGAVRSGKSALAEKLAESLDRGVVVAVAGWAGDGEMSRRIEAHRSSRPAGWATLVATGGCGWIDAVPEGDVLLLDCLGTLVANACHAAVGEAREAPADAEREVASLIDGLLAALIDREGPTIVVTNETGWGVVPEWPSARLFRDELGRANRRLVEASDAAYLVVDGRCLDLKTLPTRPAWPHADEEGDR